jgi:hypothetical protein
VAKSKQDRDTLLQAKPKQEKKLIECVKLANKTTSHAVIKWYKTGKA